MSIPILPDGCGYEGKDFGASYPDAKCYGGRLYDLDNCDNSGNLYEPGDFIPCPNCNHEAWLDQFKEQVECDGFNAAEHGMAESDCPYPKAGLRFQKDNDTLKRWWLAGFNSAKS